MPRGKPKFIYRDVNGKPIPAPVYERKGPNRGTAWDHEAAYKDFTTTPEPPRGQKEAYLTALAEKYGTNIKNLSAFIKRHKWNEKRQENALIFEIAKREGEDRVRRELGATIPANTTTAALAPAIHHKMALDEAADELTRRSELSTLKAELLTDLGVVNDQMRQIVESGQLTVGGRFTDMVNPSILALKVVTDTLVRRTQIISTLLGDPKKANGPGVVNNNLNLNLPEAKTQMAELQEVMETSMKFHAQPIRIYEPGEIEVDSTSFGGKPLTAEIEDAIIVAEELE